MTSKRFVTYPHPETVFLAELESVFDAKIGFSTTGISPSKVVVGLMGISVMISK